MSLPEHPGFAISSGVHLLLLAALLFSFARTSQFDDALESIPVEMVSDSEFNQIMKGEKTAAKQAKPLQRAEKRAEIAEQKPPSPLAEAKTETPAPPSPLKREPDPGRDEPKAPPIPPERSALLPPPRPSEEPVKPAVKPEPVKPSAPPPPPESAEAIDPKPVPRPRIEPKAEPKQDVADHKPKPVEKPQKPEPKFKPDQLAKLLDQEKQKDLQKPVEKPSPKPKSGDESTEQTQKFDPGDISKFLSKEAPQRKASTGRELQQIASLGSPTANADKMSPSLWGQLDGLLQEQYKRCWNFIGLAGQKKYVPEIHVEYAQDGSLIGQPALLNPPSDPNLRNLADSALRAVRRCDPLHIPARYQPYYNEWKGRIVRFDPEEML